MNYMELVKRSISNAWKYRFLWFFGFFAHIVGGFGSNWSSNLDSAARNDLSGLNVNPAILVFLVIAAFVLWVIFFIMSVLSEGALIHGISRKELKLDVDFTGCWSVGLGKFFRLLGVTAAAFLAIILALLGLGIVVAPAYFMSIALGIVLTVFALPILLAAIFVVLSVKSWAMRFAVLDDESWVDAISKGWKLFKDNVGRTFGVALSSILTQLALSLLLVMVALILAIPFVIAGLANLWLGLLPGIAFALVVVVLSSAFFGTFTSSMWTLGFMQMGDHTGAQTVAVPQADPSAGYAEDGPSA